MSISMKDLSKPFKRNKSSFRKKVPCLLSHKGIRICLGLEYQFDIPLDQLFIGFFTSFDHVGVTSRVSVLRHVYDLSFVKIIIVENDKDTV